MATCLFAASTGQTGWAVLLGVLNLVFYLYPVMHQRYKRARLREARPPVAPTASPASP